MIPYFLFLPLWQIDIIPLGRSLLLPPQKKKKKRKRKEKADHMYIRLFNRLMYSYFTITEIS